MLSLDKLTPGDTAVVDQINNNGVNNDDLMEMGLIAGTQIRLIKFAPLGDPLEIKLRGYHLSIRKSAANSIMVTRK